MQKNALSYLVALIMAIFPSTASKNVEQSAAGSDAIIISLQIVSSSINYWHMVVSTVYNYYHCYRYYYYRLTLFPCLFLIW